MYKVEIMDRDARHRDFNSQVAISDKADELGIRQQLSGYSQMTPEQRRAVSPQVSRLAEELGHRNADGIKRFLLPPYMLFDSRDYQAKYDQKTAAATKQAPLPVGWAAHTDTASGKTFYAHAATGTSQWGFPVATALAPASAERAYSASAYGVHGAYGAFPRPTSVKDRLAIQGDICKNYIAKLKQVKEELERVNEENARLEKENAALIELLPGRGRGGSRKRTIRRKRH